MTNEITLSARERDVVQLIVDGYTNLEIGRRLGITDKTVKNHVSRILEKCTVTSRTQLAVHAIRSGIVALDLAVPDSEC